MCINNYSLNIDETWFLVIEINLAEKNLVCVIIDITTGLILNFCIKTKNLEDHELNHELKFTSKEILDFYKKTIKNFQKPIKIKYNNNINLFSEKTITHLPFFNEEIKIWALRNNIKLDIDLSLMGPSIHYLIQIYLIKQISLKRKNDYQYKLFKQTWPDDYKGRIEPKLTQYFFRKFFFKSTYFNQNIDLKEFLELVINKYNIDCKNKSFINKLSIEQLKRYNNKNAVTPNEKKIVKKYKL